MSDGNLIEAVQSFALRDTVSEEYGIEVFKIGETNQLINGGIVAHISFFIRIFLSPFLCSQAEKGYIQHIGLLGIDKRTMVGIHLGRDKVGADGVGVDMVVYLRKLSLGASSNGFLFLLFQPLEFLD